MQPTKIELNKEKEELVITWEDGTVYEYPLRYLRDESPDANNKGEHILWKTIPPPPKGPDKEGKYEVKNIEVAGNYAIQITWKDGYGYGIYSYELLLQWGKMFAETKNKNA